MLKIMLYIKLPIDKINIYVNNNNIQPKKRFFKDFFTNISPEGFNPLNYPLNLHNAIVVDFVDY